jgi:hypothetical protein
MTYVKNLMHCGVNMDRADANRLLDKHKETHQLGYLDTTRALRATGDIEDDGSEGMDNEIQAESERPWENECFRLVVSNLVRHRKEEGQDSDK